MDKYVYLIICVPPPGRKEREHATDGDLLIYMM
jgi:hypothetical protein